VQKKFVSSFYLSVLSTQSKLVDVDALLVAREANYKLYAEAAAQLDATQVCHPVDCGGFTTKERKKEN
jgi:hypothetical protein